MDDTLKRIIHKHTTDFRNYSYYQNTISSNHNIVGTPATKRVEDLGLQFTRGFKTNQDSRGTKAYQFIFKIRFSIKFYIVKKKILLKTLA